MERFLEGPQGVRKQQLPRFSFSQRKSANVLTRLQHFLRLRKKATATRTPTVEATRVVSKSRQKFALSLQFARGDF